MKSIRVLVVDDLPQVRQGLTGLLQLAAKRVVPMIEVVGEAQNGLEAIRQTQALHPDVILMDLEMPVLDGYEATRQIKANPFAPRVIILSIHASLEDQQRAWEAGADNFVTKDTGYENLLKAIQAISGSFAGTHPSERENSRQ